MSYFGVSLRNGVGLGLGTVPSLTNTPLSYRLAPSLDLSFAGSDALSPAITFSRTTNATLTNSAGLVAYAPHNLLTYSEQFDNAAWNVRWGGAGAITANDATFLAPNGTQTVDKSTATVGGAGVGQAVTLTAGVTYTLSCWVNTSSNTAPLQIATSSTGGGVVASVTIPVSSTLNRYSLTYTPSTTQTYYVGVGNSVAGQTIYIWGAQLEQSSTASTYNSTTVKNLLGYTENFDNAAWTKSNASITSGFTDIYGQPFAQSITATLANATVLSSYTAVASTPYTFSVYLQRVSGTGNVDISVDGTTWVTQTLTTTLQRFTVTGTLTAGAKTPGIRVVSSGDVVIAFGAQLSDSASVDPYVYQPVAAPSSVAYYGPRFDYDPVTLQPKGLLIEEQRTNLVLQSGDLSNAAWATKSGTFTANAAVAPDGTTTATSCVATSSDPYVYQSVTLAATTYTMSVWIKGTGVSVGKTGTIRSGANVSPAITITNAWQRITYTFTATAGAVNCGFEFPDGSTTATGDTVYYWGAQLEAGAFATSYIPTVASQVTRAADSASMIGNNFARWYNVNAGSLFIQFQLISGNVAGNNANIVAFEGAAGANMTLHRDSAAGWRYRTNLANLNVTGVFDVASNKTVFAYATSDYPFDAAGGAVQLNTGVGAPPVTTSLLIGAGSNYAAAKPINGTISRIAYYPKRLSNTELQGITA